MARAEPLEAFHTRILRLTLAVQESRTYWESVEPRLKGTARVERAFSERWFGNKSLARVTLLLNNFAVRFDAYPEALELLRRWRPTDPTTRALVCHWHLQLADPLYRAFTGDWLPEWSAAGPDRSFDRNTVARWLVSLPGSTWAPATRFQFATKLMTTAGEAGLLSAAKRGARTVLRPRVPDEALGYLVRLLRLAGHPQSWTDNPFFRSVGLDADTAEARLRRLPNVTYRRLGNLVELEATPLGALS